MMLQEDLLKILPMINEANAMSEELDKKVCNTQMILTQYKKYFSIALSVQWNLVRRPLLFLEEGRYFLCKITFHVIKIFV